MSSHKFLRIEAAASRSLKYASLFGAAVPYKTLQFLGRQYRAFKFHVISAHIKKDVLLR